MQKNWKVFERWELWPQTLNGFRQLSAPGRSPHTPKHSPPIANFWLCTKIFVNHKYKKVGAWKSNTVVKIKF